MTWVVRAPDVVAHECEPPMRDHMVQLPRGPACGRFPAGKTLEDYPESNPVAIGEYPDGQVGDVWRCNCGTLWRIIPAERRRYANILPDPYPRWREAGWWTRFRYRYATRHPEQPEER